MGTTMTSGLSSAISPSVTIDPSTDKVTIGPFATATAIWNFKIFSPGAIYADQSCILNSKFF